MHLIDFGKLLANRLLIQYVSSWCFFFFVFLFIPADSNDLLKDNARKFGSGGQTLTPRHTIDAILGLKNRNGNGNTRPETVSDGKWTETGLNRIMPQALFEYIITGSVGAVIKANRFLLPVRERQNQQTQSRNCISLGWVALFSWWVA